MTLELDAVSFVATQEFATFTTGSPFNDDITLSSDGSYAYTMASESGDENIYRFPLATPGLLSSILASDKKFNLEGLVTLINHRGHTWNAAGTKLYVADIANVLNESFIQQFTLGVAWDPSTISGVVTKDISATISVGNLKGIDVVGSDGYLFAVDASVPSVVKFTMTAGDISTLADSGDSYTTTPLTASPRGVRVGGSGTRLYINQEWPSIAYQTNLSVGYDITTLSDSGNSLAIATELPGEQTSGFAISANDTCIYFSAFNADMDMLQYCQAAAVSVDPCTGTYIEGGTVRLAIGVLAGFWWLGGGGGQCKSVTALVDGNVTQLEICDGVITFPRLAARAHIGLPYTTDIETLNIEVEGGGTIQGGRKKVTDVTTRFFRSRLPLIGPNFSDMVQMKQREDEKYGESTTLLTGDKTTNVPPDWNSHGRLAYRIKDPVPCTWLAIIPEFEVEDDG